MRYLATVAAFSLLSLAASAETSVTNPSGDIASVVERINATSFSWKGELGEDRPSNDIAISTVQIVDSGDAARIRISSNYRSDFTTSPGKRGSSGWTTFSLVLEAKASDLSPEIEIDDPFESTSGNHPQVLNLRCKAKKCFRGKDVMVLSSPDAADDVSLRTDTGTREAKIYVDKDAVLAVQVALRNLIAGAKP